ncbi:hypothetical protein ANANG_G00303220 [Anguilla anguilla]|uniref:Uncharacterized protein n=1 Tax=Anguilla anguilla TaxID=7936 RepID=A0A9D3RIH9_ANGAN|nr:hypothetical protein ANANG_G00303220 [Anguilla anguilla]
MGNESSTAEGPATAYTESQTGEQRDSKPENGSVLTEPPAAQPESDVLRFSEEEENRREEDKEELLFTDDLLPNIDLSSELNLWGSSFSTQVSEGEMKTEQVTLSSSPNPLLAGLHHYTEASPPAVVIVKSPAPDTSSCTGDPHLRGTPPPLHLQPQTPDTPSDTPPFQNPLALMDRELQEAFQECEQHMASLLMPCPPAEATPTREADECLSVPLPEDSEDEGAGTLRSESVKGGSELSPHPPEALTKQGRGTQTQSDLPISTMPPRQALNDTLKETPTEAVAKPALDTTEQTRSGTNPATPTEPGAELLRESRDRGSVPAELQASSQLCRAIKMEAERDSQPPADGRTGGPHHPVTGPETPHRNQPTREGSKNDKNAPATSRRGRGDRSAVEGGQRGWGLRRRDSCACGPGERPRGEPGLRRGGGRR